MFPHQKSLEEKGDFALEEERRLAYVGITRAKKEAYLSFAMKRAYHGDWMDALPSRFINEIPDESVEKMRQVLPKQMILILIKTTQLNLMKDTEALVGIDIKRIRYLNGKNKKN